MSPKFPEWERVASSGLWTSDLLFRGEKRQQRMRLCSQAIKIKFKDCFLSGHHAKVVLTFAALIRTLLSDHALNFNKRKNKQCPLWLYKRKHRVTCTRGLFTELEVV